MISNDIMVNGRAGILNQTESAEPNQNFWLVLVRSLVRFGRFSKNVSTAESVDHFIFSKAKKEL